MPVDGRRLSAFALFDLLAALAIAVGVAAGVTAVIMAGQELVARSTAGAIADQAAVSAFEALVALPFSSADSRGGPSLVESLFPHADVGRNTAAASYHPAAEDGRPAGAFVTLTAQNEVPLALTASFVRIERGGWETVVPVAGYSCETPPTDRLVVRIAPVGADDSASLVVVVPGLSEPPAEAVEAP